MIKDDVRKGFTSAIYNYLGLLFEKLVTVFVTVYVIRELQIVEFGLFNIFQDTIALVAVVFSFGIPSLIERFLPELYERGLFAELHRWVNRALIARFLLGLLGAGICFFGRGYLGSFLQSADFSKYFPVFAAGLVFTILNQTSQSVLDTFLQQKRRNLIRIIVSAVRAGLYFLAIQSGWGLLGVLWSFSISSVVGSVLFIYAIKKLHYPENAVPHEEGMGSLQARFRRYGAYSYFNEMGGLVLSRRVDNYLISSLANTFYVGLYSFAVRVVEMILALTPIKVGEVIISTILYRQFTENPTTEFLQRRFHLLCKLALYLTLPLLIILVGLSRPITSLIGGEKYSQLPEASQLIVVIAVFQILNVFSWPIAWMAQSVEKVEIQLYSKISAIYNLGSALYLIPRYGALGAAWATGTSALLKNTLMYIFLRRHVPVTVPLVPSLKLGGAAIIGCAALFLLQPLAVHLVNLAWIAAVGSLTFLVAAKFFRPFDLRERNSFEKALGRKIWFV